MYELLSARMPLWLRDRPHMRMYLLTFHYRPLPEAYLGAAAGPHGYLCRGATGRVREADGEAGEPALGGGAGASRVLHLEEDRPVRVVKVVTNARRIPSRVRVLNRRLIHTGEMESYILGRSGEFLVPSPGRFRFTFSRDAVRDKDFTDERRGSCFQQKKCQGISRFSPKYTNHHATW